MFMRPPGLNAALSLPERENLCHANFGPTAWLCTYRKKGGHNRYFFADAAFEEYIHHVLSNM